MCAVIPISPLSQLPASHITDRAKSRDYMIPISPFPAAYIQPRHNPVLSYIQSRHFEHTYTELADSAQCCVLPPGRVIAAGRRLMMQRKATSTKFLPLTFYHYYLNLKWFERICVPSPPYTLLQLTCPLTIC